MGQKKLLFADHTREELRILAPTAMVILPVGATEQHGPHLPVGTDYFIAEHLALEAARRMNAEFPVLVAPALPFGCSEHHLPFGGTLSLRTEAYYRAISDLLRSLALDGFRRVFVLNGHGGNHELVKLAARDTALDHPLHIGSASYWTLAWDGLVAAGAHRGGGLPGHAGRFETSLMLALRGQMVSTERPRRDAVAESDAKVPHDPYREEVHGFWQNIDGYTDSPANGSPELGAEYLNALIESIAQSLASFYRSTLAVDNGSSGRNSR